MKGLTFEMTKRVWIGVSVLVLVVLAVVLCMVFFRQSVPMEGTLI